MLFLVSWRYQAPQSIMVVVVEQKHTPGGLWAERSPLLSHRAQDKTRSRKGSQSLRSCTAGVRLGGRSVVQVCHNVCHLKSTCCFFFFSNTWDLLVTHLIFKNTSLYAYRGHFCTPRVKRRHISMLLSGTNSFRQYLWGLLRPEILTTVLHDVT